MSSSVQVYALLVGLVALERLWELRLSRRNREWALAQGGVESARRDYPWMVGAHALFLVACLAEVSLMRRPFLPALAWSMSCLLGAAMALRYWAVATLGRRWNTRVIVVPGVAPVTGGPYRFVRHPNYLAVAVEGFGLPLIHTAWCTALIFSFANALLLRRRIRIEEEALARGSNYQTLFAGRPRLWPGGPRGNAAR